MPSSWIFRLHRFMPVMLSRKSLPNSHKIQPPDHRATEDVRAVMSLSEKPRQRMGNTMTTKHRKTFEQILGEAAAGDRSKDGNEGQASFNRLPNSCLKVARTLYAIEHLAIRHLFRLQGQAPTIRDAWSSGRGYLLSVRLQRTSSLLHVPFDELRMTTQQAHASWVAQRARGRWWRPRTATNRSAFGSEAA